MKIRKAVITATGWGARFLSATKAQPKEMLPLLNKPIIQYVVEEAVASGIEQIVVITAMGKHSVEDHFDHSFELEHVLYEKGMSEALAEVSSIGNSSKICYVRQQEQLGLGHTVLIVQDFIGNEPFTLLLPDDVVRSEVPVTKQLMKAFEQQRDSILAIEEVPGERVSSYCIIKPRQLNGHLYRVLGLVEKPDARHAPSRLGIVGRYVLTPEIFPALEQTLPGKGGEIQLTAGLSNLLPDQPIFGYKFEGIRSDVSTPLGLLKVSLAFALEDPEMAGELREYLTDLNLYAHPTSVSLDARNSARLAVS